MELDQNSLDGHWAKDNNLGVEFFIINDAVFSKLCILGDDVEPCFEGSSVTATSSGVERTFTRDKDFSTTLFTMMNELTDALQSKGGLEMPNEFAEQTETAEVNESTEFAEVAEEKAEVTEETVDYTNAEEAPAAGEAETEFKSNDDDKDDSEDEEASDSEDEEDDDDDKKPASNHSLEEFETLNAELESLRAEVESLREFKLAVENEQKDALMDSFPYNTLSAEDKAEVMEHKSEYSLDEIKAKLAVIYVEKGVQFSAHEDTSAAEEEQDEEAITTFSLDGEVAEPLSGLQEALRKTKQN